MISAEVNNAHKDIQYMNCNLFQCCSFKMDPGLPIRSGHFPSSVFVDNGVQTIYFANIPGSF